MGAVADRLERTSLWSRIGVIGAMGAAAACLGALLASETSGAWSDLWSDVASAGVGVVAVGVVGGALTAAWKAIEAQREAAALTENKIRVEFAELIVLYNGVKSVRRALRGLGLDAKLLLDPKEVEENEGRDKGYYETAEGLKKLEAVGLAVELTREQAAGFQEQMGRLNELQLRYEAKKRQFEQADLLGEDRARVAAKLEDIEGWLNDLVGLWEEHGWEIREGTKLVEVSPGLQPLFRKRIFRPNFSTPMDDLTDLFNAHLFGAPLPETTKTRSRDVRGGGGKTTAALNRPKQTPPGAIGEQAEQPAAPRTGADHR